MTLLTLVLAYLRDRPLSTLLNILLLSLGIAVITILLLFKTQMEEKISRNTTGIDLVIGAKGSPLQLILCNVFHVDVPTGNIPLAEAERFAGGRLVRKAIPLALGDSYKGYRIAGTDTSYASLYGAELAEGAWWHSPMEVTLGARVAKALAMKPGDEFLSMHGLEDEGHAHESVKFVVSGILKPSHSVVDDLILTSVQTVWRVHDIVVPEADGKHSPIIPGVAAGDSTLEITAMLIRYRSPMAAVQLPRIVNGQSNLQAASPAFESARLFSILGVGVEVLSGFAGLLILVSALSIFIALYNSLKERRYDLAMMRAMGASPGKLYFSVVLEGMIVTTAGAVAGLALAHLSLQLLPVLSREIGRAGISGLVFYREEWIILVASLFLGLLCSLIPARTAYKTDISSVLAEQS